jgi:hypothetical protein
MLCLMSGITGKLFWWALWKIFLIQYRFCSMHVSIESFVVAFYLKKENYSIKSQISRILINPKFVLVSSTGSMWVVIPIKSMKHKYELLLNGRKMSGSVEIVKSTMFYLIGMCPHLFLLKVYPCSWNWNYTLECFHYLWSFLE